MAVISPKKRSKIEPGGRGANEMGNEMDVKTGMALKPGGDFGVLMSGIVVADGRR